MVKTKKFQTVQISRKLKESVVNSVIKKLNLKDKFQLNDRLDGIYYLNKHIARIYSCFCIQEILKIELTTEEKPLFGNTSFNFNHISYHIISTTSIDRIKIPINTITNIFVVVLIDINSLSTQYIGMIKKEECEELIVSNKTIETIDFITKKSQIIINSSFLK
jgi:hypothetical protein